MARYTVSVTSAANIPGGGVAGATGSTSCFLVLPAVSGFKLRRVTVGMINGTTALTTIGYTMGICRLATAGTATTTVTATKMDPNNAASGITPATAWTTTGPTFTTAPYAWSVPVAGGVTVDLSWELLEELATAGGAGNGFAFVNQGSTIASGASFVLTAEWEE